MWRGRAALLLIALAGCSRPSGSTLTPATPRLPWSEPEQKAVDAARQLLDRQGLAWGQPDRVDLTPDGKAYWITYPTPDSEIKVLGPRAVTVDVKTGEAKLEPVIDFEILPAGR